MLKLSTDGWIVRELGVSNVKVVNRWMDSQGAGEISNVKVVNRWMDTPGSWGVSNVKVVNRWMDSQGAGGKQC